MSSGPYSSQSLEPALLKGEFVLYVTRHHWIYHLRALSPLLLVLLAGSFAWMLAPGQLTLIITVIASIVASSWMLLKVVETCVKKCYITNKRLIYRTGWTQRDMVDVMLDRIGGIKLDQDVWQRFLGYGTVQVIVPVVQIILPRYLANPTAFRNTLYMSIRTPGLINQLAPEQISIEYHSFLDRILGWYSAFLPVGQVTNVLNQMKDDYEYIDREYGRNAANRWLIAEFIRASWPAFSRFVAWLGGGVGIIYMLRRIFHIFTDND